MQTSFGEAVFCTCGKMLLASPDDDIDPVMPSKQYDADIYHRFARPASWSPTRQRQRTLKRAPVANEWAVVFDYKRMVDGVEHDLDGGEGRVVSVDPTTVTIALSDGIAGSSQGERHITIPIEHVRPMIFDTLRKEDQVTILRGPGAGSTGVVKHFEGGMDKSGSIGVLVKGKIVTIPVERLEKIHEPATAPTPEPA